MVGLDRVTLPEPSQTRHIEMGESSSKGSTPSPWQKAHGVVIVLSIFYSLSKSYSSDVASLIPFRSNEVT